MEDPVPSDGSSADDTLLAHGTGVGTYATVHAAHQHGLVVLAMGLPYWVRHDDNGWSLVVEAQEADAVREQIGLFDSESVNWPPRQPSEVHAVAPAAIIASMVWVLAEMSAFSMQTRTPGRWEAFGALDSRALFHDGEWWRPATALFLHGDAGHLFSNLGFGFFAFIAVASTFGCVRGWSLLAAASVAGNVAAAAIHLSDSYLSLGASTGVFAGLGLLCGRATWRARELREATWWRGVFVPLVAGFTLLGLLGAGDLRTDVVAHATGFGSGMLAGFLACLANQRR